MSFVSVAPELLGAAAGDAVPVAAAVRAAPRWPRYRTELPAAAEAVAEQPLPPEASREPEAEVAPRSTSP